jgi:signal transduction histidine kinase
VNEAAREVAEAFPRVELELSTEPAMANLSRAGARRILEELVENALAFSTGGASVKIRVTVVEGSPEVRVIDCGTGVDAASIERIFDPLEQGEDLNTRTHQGVGIGLTLARTSARAMDGDVTLESTGPEGSTFLWSVSRTPARSQLG